MSGDAAIYHEQLARVNNDLSTLARESARTTRVLERAIIDLEAATAEIDTLRAQLRQVHEHAPSCPDCGRTVEWSAPG